MDEIERLKKELVDLENSAKRDQEIKDLKKKIGAKKFAQSGTGKVFNKIADVGEGLGKIISNDKGSCASSQKKKVKSLSEVMRDLPQ